MLVLGVLGRVVEAGVRLGGLEFEWEEMIVWGETSRVLNQVVELEVVVFCIKNLKSLIVGWNFHGWRFVSWNSTSSVLLIVVYL